VIVLILLACCANEAGCERFFSSEGLIHTSLRNQLDDEVTASIMSIRANYEWLVTRSTRSLVVDADDDAYDGGEFIEMDVM
jgi:hypothetical protein